MARRIYKFLASLKLAVILLVALGAILAVATYYESRYDAKTAAHLVYGSAWFYLFLLMLGVNVTCAAAIRYPWKRHQTGFVITHLGIIVILLGSFVTAIAGLEGTMALSDGEKSHFVTLDRPTLSYQMLEGKEAHDEPVTAENTVSMPFELRWSPPREERPQRFPLKNGLVLVVDRYLHHAMADVAYHADGKVANPAVRFAIRNRRVNLDEWLAVADPERREMQAGPGRVRLVAAPTAGELAHALDMSPQVPPSRAGYLTFNLGKGQPCIAVEPNIGKEVAIPGSSYRLRIQRYLPHAGITQGKLVNRSERTVNPAVECAIVDSQGEAERYLLFARFPQFNTTHGKKRPTSLQVAYDLEAPKPQAGLDLILGPAGTLHYRLRSSKGPGSSGLVEVGKEVPTGWMDLTFTVKEYLPQARVEHVFREISVGNGKEGPPPAVRFTVEGADRPGPYWLGQGQDVYVSRGKQLTHLYYHLQAVDIGFDIFLKHFEVGYDPGTRNAASYASDVEVQDAPTRTSKGATFPYHICMNDPLHYKGLTFFQASFQEVEGRPTISVLQVAKDPGIWVKYLGSILLVGGIAQMFFMKPGRKPASRAETPRARGAGLPEEEVGSGVRSADEEPEPAASGPSGLQEAPGSIQAAAPEEASQMSSAPEEGTP